MNLFIKKILVLVTILTSTYLFLGFFADGYTDPFYLRFTSPKQKSLIIGTSRAAQGIQPKLLNENLIHSRYKPVFNYSFTLLHSPYGETYFNAIKAKVNDKINDGLFILAVDPWSISSRNNINYEIETKKELGRLQFYNMNPNYDYLMNAYRNSVFGLLNKKDTSMLLHQDGWLEVNVSMESDELLRRKLFKKKQYLDNAKIYEFSKKRMFWLHKTVEFLQKYGTVILVRIPVGDEILKIENTFFPNFDLVINQNFLNISYLNYKEFGNEYSYIDGNHLYKKSGEKFTLKLAKDINNIIVCNSLN
ncbi:hypothetical protein [Flavicella sp.]|uniref:hypothetical protein n=1 Tax=Flavicella sp. TaxID=2957742 RepID=UPI00261DA564|nr:hypothetical protein [Flavicella sp.]MDG1804975.1 hypothetical protein [Flavicella sp.]